MFIKNSSKMYVERKGTLFSRARSIKGRSLISKKLFIILLILSITCSIAVVSASNIDDVSNTTLQDVPEDIVIINDVGNDNTEEILEEPLDNSKLSNEDKTCTIFIDSNDGDDVNGNGSESHPYKSLERACIASQDKENVTIKLYDGIYTMGLADNLNFNNVKNLHILGLNDGVIFNSIDEPVDDDEYDYYYYSFMGISVSNCNLTFSNVTFDFSSDMYFDGVDGGLYTFFGKDNTVIYEDCIFKGFSMGDRCCGISPRKDNNKQIINNNITFNKCIFPKITESYGDVGSKSIVIFNYCILNVVGSNTKFGYMGSANTKFYGSWFGNNNIPKKLIDNPSYYSVESYAIFNITENYKGNNNYEIIGKLVCNGTEDVIVNLPPMTVSLTSTGGALDDATATLENGTFKVGYTSTSSQNTVTATLNSAVVPLTFNTINIEASANPITYGANQNITVTLPEPMDGTITILVNNKTYNQPIFGEQVITYQIIDEILKVGNYTVNVTFTSEDSHSHGSASCYLNVSKVSEYQFNATVPKTVTIGDTVDITINLPSNVNGSVSVRVNDNPAIDYPANKSAITVPITGFVLDDNKVYITLNDENYVSKTINYTIVASAKSTKLSANNVSTLYNVTEYLIVTLTDDEGNVLANKTISIVVGTINEKLNTSDSGQISIDVSSLAPNTYEANITFAGDEIYNKSNTTAKVTIKEEIKPNIVLPEITAGQTTKTTIKIADNATGTITVTIGNTSNVFNVTDGSATITIPTLPAGKNNVTIAYSGDDKYGAFSQNFTVEVKEPVKPTPKPDPVKPAPVTKQATKIIAKNKKFKAKTKVKKYTITLKTKAGKAIKKVQVTIKIGKKTYKAKTNAKGKATFKIKKLTKKGKYKATIKFKGNKLYKACSKKVKITIKK